MPELAIYKPKGKAAEYSEYACNFYVGCSGNCSYCYLKKGRGYKILGGNKPRLKACFKDEEHAMRIFAKELDYNISELRKSGIFFSFTCDPLSNETKELTYQAIELCNKFKVYANILTKQIDFEFDHMDENYTSIGFTLTGSDNLERGCPTNFERIEKMKNIFLNGFDTFTSIEPIINFDLSLTMIRLSAKYCNHYKIGLESGSKHSRSEINNFCNEVLKIIPNNSIYWKKSISNKIPNTINNH